MRPFYSKDFSFHKNEIHLKRDEILKALQVPLNQSEPYVDEMIAEYSIKALEICSPRSRFVVYDKPEFTSTTFMKLNGLNFHLDRIVSASLKKSSHIALFAGTAGSKVEELSKQLILEGHLLEGLIMDILGAEIAEETARLIHEKIGEEMLKMNFKTTNRYSPGYCNWPVSDQQKLFSLLGENTCGIKLTESSLMLPIKSVSGIVGVGTEVKYQNYFCDKCKVASCIFRDKS